MDVQPLKRRLVDPALPIFIVAILSGAGYFGSRHLAGPALHQLTAAISGTLYFLSIAFGTLYVYTTAMVRGAGLGERILASAVTPVCWMTKEVLLLTHAHPFAQALYWYANPLNFWLTCLMALEMGGATLVARKILKNRGVPLKVITPAPLAVIFISLFLVIAAYAWGRGENLYVIFLEGYRWVFGAGL